MKTDDVGDRPSDGNSGTQKRVPRGLRKRCIRE